MQRAGGEGHDFKHEEGFSEYRGGVKKRTFADTCFHREERDSLDEKMNIGKHRKCLEPSVDSRDANTFVLPQPVEFQDLCMYKVAFIQQSATLQGALTQQLAALNARATFSDNKLCVESTLTPSHHRARELAHTWTNDIQDAVNFIFSMIVVLQQKVTKEIWDETEKGVATMKPASRDSAIIFTLSQEKMFLVVGMKHMADDLMAQLKQLIAQNKREAERKKQEVTETIGNLKPFQLSLLAAMSFQSEAAKRHPGLQVEICAAKGEISYHGLIRDVKEAQIKMYELLTAVRLKKLTFSSLQTTLLGVEETRNYVFQKLKADRIVATWDVDSQGKVTAYSLDENHLVNACHMIQKAVVQYPRPLLSEEAELVTSSQWTQFAGQLTSDYPGVLKIALSQNGRKLLIAGTDNIMYVVIEEVARFFTKNTIYMLSCHFSPSRQDFVTNYWLDRVVCIRNKLRADYEVGVSLDESEQSFDICGTQTGLNIMIKMLQLLGSMVKCHTETLTDQVKVRFLSLRNCVRDLEKLGRSIHCVFSLEEEPASLMLENFENSWRVIDDAALSPVVVERQHPRCSPEPRDESCRSRRDMFNLSAAKRTQLSVYGESQTHIRRALSRFDDLVKEKFAHNQIVDVVIQNMNEEELQSVRDVGKTCNVEVQIESLDGSIIVDGLPADVLRAGDKIRGIIHEAARYRHLITQAALRGCTPYSTVQWCYIENTRGGMEEVKYSKCDNFMIESAYKEKRRTTTITDAYGVQYVIDFDTMKEYPASDPKDTADVIRRNKMNGHCCI